MLINVLYRSFIFALLLIFSCGDSVEAPIELIERMKIQACEADLEGFYSKIDKISIEHNLKNAILESLDQQTITSDELKETEEIIIPTLLVLKWEVLNREINLGQAGAYCNMEVLDNSNLDENLRLLFPNGKTSTWGFEAKNGELFLVAMIDEEPFDFAKLDLGLTSNNKDPLEHTSIITQSKKLNQKTVEPKTLETKEDNKPETKKSLNSEMPPIIDTNNIDTVSKEHISSDIIELEEDNFQPIEQASSAIQKGGYSFGKARWGMTRDQVRASERIAPISEAPHALVYNSIYNGYRAKIYYVFSGNRLSKGKYLMSNSNDDEIIYLANYMRIKDLLSLKYGSPQTDEEKWINSLYMDKPEKHGFALLIGHLIYRSKWITSRETILLELKSDNYDILLEAIYNSR